MAVNINYTNPTSYTYLSPVYILNTANHINLINKLPAGIFAVNMSLPSKVMHGLGWSYIYSPLSGVPKNGIYVKQGTLNNIHIIGLLLTTYPPVYRTSLGANSGGSGSGTNYYATPRMFPPLLGTKKNS